MQAGTQFCDSGFQREVASGTLSSSTLDNYCCISLAGVASEYIHFGQSEGGLNDVQQLDNLLRALRVSFYLGPSAWPLSSHANVCCVISWRSVTGDKLLNAAYGMLDF